MDVQGYPHSTTYQLFLTREDVSPPHLHSSSSILGSTSTALKFHFLRLNNSSSPSLSLYDKCSNPFAVSVSFCWTHSSTPVSLVPGAQLGRSTPLPAA